MLQLAVRMLLIAAGVVASWFVARDALNFEFIQMIVAVILFTILLMGIAFWSTIKAFSKDIWKRIKSS